MADLTAHCGVIVQDIPRCRWADCDGKLAHLMQSGYPADTFAFWIRLRLRWRRAMSISRRLGAGLALVGLVGERIAAALAQA
jgi:hypothetical protein